MCYSARPAFLFEGRAFHSLRCWGTRQGMLRRINVDHELTMHMVVLSIFPSLITMKTYGKCTNPILIIADGSEEEGDASDDLETCKFFFSAL